MRTVRWGEFRFKEVFSNIAQGRRLRKEDQIAGEIPFIMAGTTNTGVVGYISNPVATFPENAITVDIFGNAFYRGYAFGAGDDTGVYWNDRVEYSPPVMLFLTAAMNRSLQGKYSYGKKLRSSQSGNLIMKLPVTPSGEMDFVFMESVIAELEAERVAELTAYLKVSDLDNYKLSSSEEEALTSFKKLDWETFNLEKLFGKSTRGKRLKSDDRLPGSLPFVTAGEASEGISAFIRNEVEVFNENTVTIDMFGSAKYRNYRYGADDHVAVVHTDSLPVKAAIFVTSAIHKMSHTGKFDYSRNFYAKDADALNIMLPVKEGKPDIKSMELLISAVHKIVIKEVVELRDKKIEAAKKLTS